jgi:hypothetical protein
MLVNASHRCVCAPSPQCHRATQTTVLPLDPVETYTELGCRHSVAPPTVRVGWLSCSDENASWRDRIAFVNRTVAQIDAKQLDRSSRVTLISPQAGGVLTEFLIDRQLRRLGFSDVQWRLISRDPGYRPQYVGAHEDFAKKVSVDCDSRSNVEVFDTVPQYLNSQAAIVDSNVGLTVLLEVDAPEFKDVPASFIGGELHRPVIVRGCSTNYPTHANAGCLVIVPASRSEDLWGAVSSLVLGKTIVFDRGFKFIKTDEGFVGHEVCNDLGTMKVAKDFERFVEGQTGLQSPLEWHDLFDQSLYLRQFEEVFSESSPDYRARFILVFDFDVCASSLADRFEGEAGQFLFASLPSVPRTRDDSSRVESTFDVCNLL